MNEYHDLKNIYEYQTNNKLENFIWQKQNKNIFCASCQEWQPNGNFFQKKIFIKKKYLSENCA